MSGPFTVVVVIVAVVGVLGAIAALASSRRTWEAYGRDHLLMDSDVADRRRPTPASGPAAQAERVDEIRQMLAARNARRRRRGEPEVDVEDEVARLTAAPAAGRGVDPELRAEIAALVRARHARRARRDPAAAGPLDLEAEVEREIARLTGAPDSTRPGPTRPSR